MKHEEDNLTMACVRWFKMQYPEPKYLIHHSPNEGKRNRKVSKYGTSYSPEATRLKHKGTRAGFPDLIIMTKGHTFFIEMKSDSGKLSESQMEIGIMLTKFGHPYYVCNSLNMFMDICNNEINNLSL